MLCMYSVCVCVLCHVLVSSCLSLLLGTGYVPAVERFGDRGGDLGSWMASCMTGVVPGAISGLWGQDWAALTDSCLLFQGLRKSSSAGGSRRTIVPRCVPHMVQLHKYIVSDESVFLVLQHAEGAWAHLEPRTPAHQGALQVGPMGVGGSSTIIILSLMPLARWQACTHVLPHQLHLRTLILFC